MTGPLDVPLLEADGLTVEAASSDGPRRVLDSVSFTLAAGETLCLLGQAEAGKSVAALALMRLLPRPSLHVTGGAVRFAGRDLATLPDAEMRQLRGAGLAFVGADPMTALNPLMTVGAQLTETIRTHDSAEDADQAARQALDLVHMPEAARRLTQYPHELSAGMRQLAVLALALCGRPRVLVADEPAATLDLTVQDELLALLRDLRNRLGFGLLLLTRDRRTAADADRVAILRGGRIVEQGPVQQVFAAPGDPYTRGLLAVGPRLGARAGSDGPPRLTDRSPPVPASRDPVLRVRDLTVEYGGGRHLWGAARAGRIAAQDVSFTLLPSETLGLIGESGAGTSSVGMAVLGLVRFTGEIEIDGTAINGLRTREMRSIRRITRFLPADAAASLDPRWSVGASVAEPLAVHGIGSRADRRDRVAELIHRIGLPPDIAARRPHELSPGQRQRVCLARALATDPKLIVADQCTEGLDLGARAGLLELMLQVQEALGIAYLFISRDPEAVELMSHHVAVMRESRILESGSRRQLFEQPRNSYVRDLLAVPDAVPQAARG